MHVAPQHPTKYYLYKSAPTTETYTLSLHDALPISINPGLQVVLADRPGLLAHFTLLRGAGFVPPFSNARRSRSRPRDRKSTRLNSSHRCISYAVFCLKKKKQMRNPSHNTARTSFTR